MCYVPGPILTAPRLGRTARASAASQSSSVAEAGRCRVFRHASACAGHASVGKFKG